MPDFQQIKFPVQEDGHPLYKLMLQNLSNQSKQETISSFYLYVTDLERQLS